jgi:hypothetical protein
VTSPWPALAGTAITDTQMTNLIETRLDALDAAVASLPGEIAYNEIVATSAAFTTIADIAGLSVSFTLLSTRTVRIDVFAIVQSNTAADRIQLTLADASNNVLQVTGDLPPIPAANSSVEGLILWRKSLPAGSYTYKVRANRQAGTGTCVVNAAATRPAFIQALDVT